MYNLFEIVFQKSTVNSAMSRSILPDVKYRPVKH